LKSFPRISIFPRAKKNELPSRKSFKFLVTSSRKPFCPELLIEVEGWDGKIYSDVHIIRVPAVNSKLIGEYSESNHEINQLN
jgi:hypothetical protein